MFRAFWVFCKDAWQIMAGPQTEIEREAARIKAWKETGLIRSGVLYPAEQTAEHEKAHRIALKWRNRNNKNIVARYRRHAKQT